MKLDVAVHAYNSSTWETVIFKRPHPQPKKCFTISRLTCLTLTKCCLQEPASSSPRPAGKPLDIPGSGSSWQGWDLTSGGTHILQPRGQYDLRQSFHLRALLKAEGQLLGSGSRELVELDTEERHILRRGNSHLNPSHHAGGGSSASPNTTQSPLTPSPSGTPCPEVLVPGSSLLCHRCNYCTSCRGQRKEEGLGAGPVQARQ